jgi:hypothetical protein
MDQRPTLVKAVIIDSSEVDEVGSALRRTEPERMKGSCGMVTTLERIISRGRTWRSTPSIVMVPDSISRILSRTERSELFPLFWSES